VNGKVPAAARAPIAWTLLAMGLAASPAPAADRGAGLARLAGVWQLDARVSDDPLRMVRSAESRRPAPGRSERGRAEGGRPEPGAEQLAERVTEVVAGANVLVIAWNDPRLTITTWDDRERTLVVGRKVDEEGPRGPVRVTASWKGSDRLVVATEGDPAGRRLEIYELGGRGDQLFVTVELKVAGSKWPFSFERVYNRVAAGE